MLDQVGSASMETLDVIVIGGGAAGLFCAFSAGQRGYRVRVLEGSNRIGKKILMSGGGRCNFTNLRSTPANFLSDNPHFCKSALARYTPYDFLDLVEKHSMAYCEKTPGQLFCTASAKPIVAMLADECAQAAVRIDVNMPVKSVEKSREGFVVHTDHATMTARAVVVASGGLSIPKMGATDVGYRIARSFGLAIRPTRAALVPFTFTGDWHERMARLRGVSVEGAVTAGRTRFDDGILFTHRGLSGPAALQASSYWREGEPIHLSLQSPAGDAASLLDAKRHAPTRQLQSTLSRRLPKALAAEWIEGVFPAGVGKSLGDLPDAKLSWLEEQLAEWPLKPSGTEGYRTAEVTLGGVDTHALDSRTMAARDVPGLYFIGEVVDVTGHLGGHNFQWAWASGHAAAQAL
ncbi:MAG: NAD(P)/FAD-dependent oxidoreductase [Pseudomonadota bacterium]